MEANAGHAPLVLRTIDGRPASVVALIVAALIAGIGWVDYLTGWELSFSIFYMVPVALGSWRSGMWAALLLSLLCAVAWLTADHLSGHVYSQPWIPFWNALVRMGMFLALGLTLAALSGTLRIANQLARVDMLTGLANARAFHETLAYHLDAATRHRDPMTLAMIDLDHFKRVNDEMGHAEGDRALAEFAESLRHTVRKVDLTARTGGDEFVVLLPRTGRAGALEALENVRHAVEETMRRHDWPITASIGAVSWQGRIQADELLRASDRVLYRAKAQGGNCVLTEVFESPIPPASGPDPVAVSSGSWSSPHGEA